MSSLIIIYMQVGIFSHTFSNIHNVKNAIWLLKPYFNFENIKMIIELSFRSLIIKK